MIDREYFKTLAAVLIQAAAMAAFFGAILFGLARLAGVIPEVGVFRWMAGVAALFVAALICRAVRYVWRERLE